MKTYWHVYTDSVYSLHNWTCLICKQWLRVSSVDTSYDYSFCDDSLYLLCWIRCQHAGGVVVTPRLTYMPLGRWRVDVQTEQLLIKAVHRRDKLTTHAPILPNCTIKASCSYILWYKICKNLSFVYTTNNKINDTNHRSMVDLCCFHNIFQS